MSVGIQEYSNSSSNRNKHSLPRFFLNRFRCRVRQVKTCLKSPPRIPLLYPNHHYHPSVRAADIQPPRVVSVRQCTLINLLLLLPLLSAPRRLKCPSTHRRIPISTLCPRPWPPPPMPLLLHRLPPQILPPTHLRITATLITDLPLPSVQISSHSLHQRVVACF